MFNLVLYIFDYLIHVKINDWLVKLEFIIGHFYVNTSYSKVYNLIFVLIFLFS